MTANMNGSLLGSKMQKIRAQALLKLTRRTKTSGTRKMPLHIVENGTDNMTMQEELFGPFCRSCHESFDAALKYINDRERPLALYLFSYNRDLEQQVLEQTHAGGVSVNDALMHIAQDDMPFGGVGRLVWATTM